MMFDKLLTFLQDLESQNIWYSLKHIRDETLLVETCLPGERWEIEFFSDGRIEIEIFKSSGEIFGSEKLAELRDRHFENPRPTRASREKTD